LAGEREPHERGGACRNCATVPRFCYALSDFGFSIAAFRFAGSDGARRSLSPRRRANCHGLQDPLLVHCSTVALFCYALSGRGRQHSFRRSAGGKRRNGSVCRCRRRLTPRRVAKTRRPERRRQGSEGAVARAEDSRDGRRRCLFHEGSPPQARSGPHYGLHRIQMRLPQAGNTVVAKSLDVPPTVIAKPVVWAEAISFCRFGDCHREYHREYSWRGSWRCFVANAPRNDDFAATLRQAIRALDKTMRCATMDL